MNAPSLRSATKTAAVGWQFIFAALIAVFAIVYARSSSAAFYDRGEGKILELRNEVSYRADDASTPSVEQLIAEDRGWTLQQQSPLPRTRDPIRIWAKFDLPVVKESTRVYVDSGPWERVEYFVVRDGKLIDRQLQGTLVPLSARANYVGMTPSVIHSGFAGVELVPGARTKIYARLATKQDHAPLYSLRFSVWDATKVLHGERRDRNIQGIYLGVMLVLIVYNLGLFFLIRESSHLYYVFMELGGVLFWAVLFGMSSEMLWPEHPALDYYSMWVGFGLSAWGMVQFLRHYLDTRQSFPRAEVLLRWASYFALSVLILAVLPWGNTLFGFSAYIVTAAGVLVVGSGFAVIVLALLHRHALAKHLFYASAVGVVAFIASVLANFGLIPVNDWTIHASQAGSAIAGIILSMGLGFKLRHARQELANKQLAEALLQTRHEREKRELVESHNRDLEAKVTERTAELVASQRQSDLLLANILPSAIIDELKANGASEPRRHEETSILFTDFSGFTQTVSTLPPKRLVQELDEIFRGFDDIVTANGLEKIKTIGDAYMVASGLPVASEDHAIRCVRAGLEMTRFIEARNQTAALKWGLRVGVHSGAVVAGIVGKNKYAYDVWGDTVNTASRLETAGEINKVNVSAYTYELVRNHFECEYRGKLTAKGKGEIDMYFVLREVSQH